MNWQALLRSKSVSYLLLVLLVVVGFFAGRMYLQKKQIDSEISNLQTQAEEIAQSNQELSGLIKYLNTPEFQEKEAREKLNLKKPDEFVVVLPDSEGELAGATTVESGNSKPSMWFNYFFNSNE